MTKSNILITGASTVLLCIVVSSCSNAGNPSTTPVAAMNNSAQTSSPPVPVPLTQFYNTQGICPDNTQFSAGVDGDGFECSSNLLGTSQSWSDVKFNIASGSESNVISCAGQSIPLPAGNFSKLEMLAMAVNGAQESQPFTVAYANTTSGAGFTQSLSDWAQPDNNPGESQAISMDYRNQADGTRDENTYYIYGYSFDLNPTNTVQSLTLPDNNNVKIFAITLVP